MILHKKYIIIHLNFVYSNTLPLNLPSLKLTEDASSTECLQYSFVSKLSSKEVLLIVYAAVTLVALVLFVGTGKTVFLQKSRSTIVLAQDQKNYT